MLQLKCPPTLNITLVERLQVEYQSIITDGQDVEVDLSDVTKADTAGLQLLVSFSKTLQKLGFTLNLVHVPECVSQVANTIAINSLLNIPESKA